MKRVYRTVLTMGTFDLLHEAHVALLAECRKLAGPDGRVVVGLNRDAFVARYKQQPTMSFEERAAVLRAVRDVDEVVENDGRDQAAVIALVDPDWLVVGMDWAGRDYYGQIGVTAQWLAERDVSLHYVAHPHSSGISSSKIRQRLQPDARWVW